MLLLQRLVSVGLCLGMLTFSAASLPPLSSGWKTNQELKDDYVSVPFPTPHDHSPQFLNYVINSTVHSTKRNYTMYVGLLQYGLPDSFSFELPPQGCCHTMKTSESAQLHHCSYATNAGFFNINNGCCVGNLITNGELIQVSNLSRVNYGISKESHVIGYISENTIKSKGFLQLITGAGWLVKNGKSYINESMVLEGLSDVFVNEKAPRTAIGAAGNGSLFIMEVDGEELTKSGVDLHEFAEIIAELGVAEAINLDGGGSSVSVKDGKVIDKPTCLDNSIKCERAVTSITCVH